METSQSRNTLFDVIWAVSGSINLAVPGIDVNVKSRSGRTALMWTASEGHTDIVGRLLAVPGIDVNAKDNNGYTALIGAAMWGHADIVRLLLAAGANVNAQTNRGDTALMVAERGGHTDVVRAINSFLAAQAMNRWIPRHRSRQRDRMALGELELSSWGRVPDGRLPSIPLEEGPPSKRWRLSSRGPGFNDLVYAYIQGFL